VLYLKRRLNEMMAAHTGQPLETIERDTDRDNFMGAEDAVEYGLVDKVQRHAVSVAGEQARRRAFLRGGLGISHRARIGFLGQGFRHMADESTGDEKLLYCSFCGKSQHEVRKLIAGPSVFICDECVELCMDIIREEHKTTLVKTREACPRRRRSARSSTTT
jgi:hypothetical protein